VVILGATGIALTVKTAPLLIAFGDVPLDTITVYVPSSAAWTFDKEYLGEFAPEIAAPSLYHWYENGAVPVASVLNATPCPAIIVCDFGCAVIVGALDAALTILLNLIVLVVVLVRVRALLFTVIFSVMIVSTAPKAIGALIHSLISLPFVMAWEGAMPDVLIMVTESMSLS
jgi:hypothetical protein